ncbi:MAG TPA: hypothetical protein VM900_14210 [Sphingomonas sp.]|nr:hypothetical protein [Sphingomonas sp.]
MIGVSLAMSAMPAAAQIAVKPGAAQVPATGETGIVPPADWSVLPLLVLPARPAFGLPLATFVQAEVKAGRCKSVVAAGALRRVESPVAILFGPAGAPRAIVPAAIDCPTVEQYTVGYVSTLLRTAIAERQVFPPGWQRLPVTYQWQE